MGMWTKTSKVECPGADIAVQSPDGPGLSVSPIGDLAALKKWRQERQDAIDAIREVSRKRAVDKFTAGPGTHTYAVNGVTFHIRSNSLTNSETMRRARSPNVVYTVYPKSWFRSQWLKLRRSWVAFTARRAAIRVFKQKI